MTANEQPWCEMAVTSPTGRERPYGYEYRFVGVHSRWLGPYFEVYEEDVRIHEPSNSPRMYVGCTGLTQDGNRWGVRGPDVHDMINKAKALKTTWPWLPDDMIEERRWPEEIYDQLRRQIVREHRAGERL